MYYIIDNATGLYFHKKHQIILFDSIDKANYFIQKFLEYAMVRMSTENRMGIPEVLMRQDNLLIKPVDFNLETVETINFNDIY